MTRQEIFNIVWDHLITKASPKSLRAGQTVGCAYRGAHGAKCAIGVLIDDATAKRWDSLSVSSVSVMELPPHLAGHGVFLRSLQLVHDHAKTPADRLTKMLAVAKRYSVTTPEGFAQ